ncbi:MAG: M13 family metallopeptidase [Deltaproteobacteria bacterium]|nr:M13 family metallopeptidase [Deltaproteobacteria bacterium]
MRLLLPLVVLAACNAASGAPTPADHITLAQAGLETASLDRSSDPCVDFYQFACGGWLANNQIPSDRARWGRLAELDEKNKAAIKTLLEDDAKGASTDPAAKKLGDFYASCMDEAGIEKAGVKPIKPLLDKAAKVKDAKSWQAALTELHKAGISVVFAASAGPDFKHSTQEVTLLDAAGLGLPDRDYYVRGEFKDKLEAYRTHVGKMLELAGIKNEQAASDVIAVETELAKLTKTAVERRDVPAAYNPVDLKGLGKLSKLDWTGYFKALGVAPSKTIVVGTPKFFSGLDALRTKLKPAQWSAYFTYHVLADASFALPKAFDDEQFELTKVLTGQQSQPERSKRCIDAASDSLGELLGQQYAAKYFPAASKQAASQLVGALVKTMNDELGKTDWMTAATRATAQAKLAKVVRMIGFPDKWRVYDFDVKRDDFAGNLLRASTFETHRVLAKAGKPVDRGEWQMNTFTVNAYYEPTENNTALPAGILQPPYFGADRGVAANFGGIGMVIGHELTHGFDDQGAQFDGDGNLTSWWSPDDKTKFDAKGQCVAEQYSTFEAAPKAFVNGKLTLGEDIADLGGVKMAFRAYRASRAGAKPIVADGFTEDQQFFIAVAQAWCSKDRPAEIQRRLTVDPHAPPKFRVYGALRNLPEFNEAFSCAAGTPMHPTKACSVW